MSRHHHRSSIGNHAVVVGWDPPLQTFFAQVWKGETASAPDAELLLWAGETSFERVDRIADLQKLLEPYGEIPVNIIDALLIEQDINGNVDSFVGMLQDILKDRNQK